MTRRALQQKIQIARRQLALEEDDYRALIARVARGKTSSKDLSERDAKAVLAEFERLGFQPKASTKKRPASEKPEVRFIYVLWRLLSEEGAVAGGRSALNGFISGPKFHAKYGSEPTDVEFLGTDRARDVIEALKDMCRRHGVVMRS